MQYDNVLMEESAQIMEIESFIPLMLQVPSQSFYLCICCMLIKDVGFFFRIHRMGIIS